jgi:hypothetical protein
VLLHVYVFAGTTEAAPYVQTTSDTEQYVPGVLVNALDICIYIHATVI